MSRIINPDSIGRHRNYLVKTITLTLRTLGKKEIPDDDARDMIAFIAIALEEISKSIDVSVTAWEKRGYWVKADRFRMEWDWTGHYGHLFKDAALSEDWKSIAALAPKIMDRLPAVKISENHRMGAPWSGAWKALGLKRSMRD